MDCCGRESLYSGTDRRRVLCSGSLDVHVWRADLDVPQETARTLMRVLSGEEIDRAERLVVEARRRHFIVARAVLRIILGAYTDVRPEELRFRAGVYGKPALESHRGREMPAFNVSHSHGLALYAIAAPGRRVGIDVEYIRRRVNWLGIAERQFAPGEAAFITGVPEDDRVHAFFRIWTRKEAYLKATGKGLSVPLNHFDVSRLPGGQACFVDEGGLLKEMQGWSFQDLAPCDGYTAALAAEGKVDGLYLGQWTGEDFGLPDGFECRGD